MDYLDKDFLAQLFSRLETQAHHIHALMSGLPKEHFYICRSYDHLRRTDCWFDDRAEHYTLGEFLDRRGKFHHEDAFMLCFCVHLDWIESEQAQEYTDLVYMDEPGDTTPPKLAGTVKCFLESYCERCQRDDRPFELTPEIIARFGFTPDDTQTLSGMLGRHNASARKLIQAEDDALAKLRFLRK